MVDDHPKTPNDRPDTLIMKTASKQNISSNNVPGLTFESLPTNPVHKFFSKDLSEILLSVHDLTSRGYEVLFSGSSAKILKYHKIVALYPKAKTDPSWHVPFENTRLTKLSNSPHDVTSKISSTHSMSPNFDHPGGLAETDKFSESFQKLKLKLWTIILGKVAQLMLLFDTK